MHIGRAKPAGAKSLGDLNAMVIIQSRRDDLETLLAGLLAQPAQLGNRLIDNRGKRPFGHHDAAAEFGVGFAKCPHLVRADDALPVVAIDIPQLGRPEHLGAKPLHISRLSLGAPGRNR
jgi:hypothetical protein